MNKNEDQDVVRRLRSIWAKDNLTMKDLLLMKACVAAGEDAATDIEENFVFVFEDIETLLGRKLDDVSLSEYIDMQRVGGGRPISQRTADILYKLLLFIPSHILREQELQKTREEYLSKVKIKDKGNPHYRRALKRANTVACMRLKRAYEEAYEEGLIDGQLYDYLMAETKKILDELSQEDEGGEGEAQ